MPMLFVFLKFYMKKVFSHNTQCTVSLLQIIIVLIPDWIFAKFLVYLFCWCVTKQKFIDFKGKFEENRKNQQTNMKPIR